MTRWFSVAAPRLSDNYTVGPQVGAGTSVITFAGGTQTIQFTGLEPVVDLVNSPSLTVNATDGDNAINYTQGSITTNGLLTVDGFESIEFANKTSLVIDALAGSDTINLNNPTTPAGLANSRSMAPIPPPATRSLSTASRAHSTTCGTFRRVSAPATS